ncbi:uncharacterized protein LOC133718889 isoform X2 [Rosa rugosa]|uniref:uncharacterized protein LOC133718889 isoform X2 n=1 Tax=Rosa rugosa TaxID=74645 RepID=UPI002B408F17|nr:uncharacterized protein LOC133718889 isoform X2 [Rosa rugosa]
MRRREHLWYAKMVFQMHKVNCISAAHKRLAEARLLLYRLAYEKAKLQLMHLKHQKILSVNCICLRSQLRWKMHYDLF